MRWLWWTASGVIFLIALVSKDFWATLGILCGAEGIAYFLILTSRANGTSADQRAPRSTQQQDGHEPTLAELIGGTPQDRANVGIAPSTRPKAAPASIAATSKVPDVVGQREPATIRREPAAHAFRPSASEPSGSRHNSTFDNRSSATAIDTATARTGPTETLYSTPDSPNTTPPLYALPRAPTRFRKTCWIPPGGSVQIAGLNLSGGMIYVGTRMDAPNGRPDPCLIDSLLPVARVGDYRVCRMGYWSSYAEASAKERRAYLNWLGEGRSNPDCDIAYVFLFFYGLERRIILDSRDDASAKGDWPAIIGELRRLLEIYGEKSGSFKHYACELLSWIGLDGESGRLYQRPVPDLPRSYELPPYLRVALGQAAVDRAALPAPLALAWVKLSPEIYLRTAATRCREEFERLFVRRYQDAFGDGLVLRKNRTKLKFVYRAASAGLLNTIITMEFGDIPDVTAVTAPINALKEVANKCTDELGSYSRLLGRAPTLTGSFEALLLLPVTIWPEEAKAKLDALVERVRGEEGLMLRAQELLASLGGDRKAATRDRVRTLARLLEGVQIGMEPNVLGGAKLPGETDNVVLFVQPGIDANSGLGPEYQTAALTLQLGAALAQADGNFSDEETVQLRAKIDGWPRLTPVDRCRLHAYLQLLVAAPPTLVTLKRKFEPLDPAARETLAAFMVTLAHADGYVSPEEVKFLERLYKALGIEPKRVFSDVQAAGTGDGRHATTTHTTKQGFHLDTDRIAALQKDTARVSALLSEIFAEDEVHAREAAPALDAETTVATSSLLGLDEAHSALARLLLSRPQWARGELEDAASDLGLMLDGALEQVNEAAFDAFDTPICEGGDPIDVNTELLEKIAA